MQKKKKLSNPFSTGGGGVHFEAHVQASFVVLMLTGGYAPCLPCWPVVEIKLQGKIDGFDTDDLIVVVENVNIKERRKLLGQVKHSISITEGSSLFGEVMQAAWNDFNNPKAFVKGKDAIALITGPLNATDAHNVQWLLNQARHTQSVSEFLRNVQQSNFSPSKSTEKLDVFQYHLKAANNGKDVSTDELYDFLRHFYLLGYDLGNEYGVVLSLLHSHISQYQKQYPQRVWSRIVDTVQTWNKDAGTITPSNLPEDLLDAFKQKEIAVIPNEFNAVQEKPITNWAQHPDATYLALMILLGSWQDNSKADLEAIVMLLGISYDEWLKKAREILHTPDSPLSLKNGRWKVINRTELWSVLGPRILDHNLDTFRMLAISILNEVDPAFELPPEERYAASIYDKVMKNSHSLRKGVSEGLAILGSQPEVCRNCTQGKAEAISLLVIRELLSDAKWDLWGSLNDVLPILAEAAPSEFIDMVEKAMRMTPCPFDKLFSQEDNGIHGSNYLTGLLWALEGLAWNEQYLVRVCVTLAELANHDPGGKWANRPSNSLVTILLPWQPQTLASIEKRIVAVRTVISECSDIAWKLLIKLLPGQHQTTSGSHKPCWRKTIPDNWEKGVTHQEYWQQVSSYAQLALDIASQDPMRLSTLIEHFDSLPQPAFDNLIKILASSSISELPEEQRLSIWDCLVKLTNKHRRFSDAKWALSEEQITRIEQVSEQLAPSNPLNLYRYLFSSRDFELYDENGDWDEQQMKLNVRREAAILEIYEQEGIEGVIRFAESVASPSQVGSAIGTIVDDVFERCFLPNYLNSLNNHHIAMVSSFIWKRHHVRGWEWCDNLEKSDWTPSQLGQFLAYFPFGRETWRRASEWLTINESEYWSRTIANAYQADEELAFAIEKLIEHGRPNTAISCLDLMRHSKQKIDNEQCVRALITALSSNEPRNTIDQYHIVELIKYLQQAPEVNQDDLFRVEWAYVPLLDSHMGASPMLLESRLANEPEFFCEIIRLIYRSKKDTQPLKESSDKNQEIATNAWHLLREWKIPPGTLKDGTFSGSHFIDWLQKVKVLCVESGHLDVALVNVGEILIYTPPDPSGLWINGSVASALNDRDADDMRDGYRIGTMNSRGAHIIDPTGTPEKELAAKFRNRAEEVENSGYQRFAATLKGLADIYEHEAMQIINNYS